MTAPSPVALSSRRRRDRDRVRAFALLGACCAVCGETNSRMLQIDHVRGARERHGEYGRSGSSLYSQLASGKRTTRGLQLLCANHNQEKRMLRREHAGYKRRRC